LGVGFGMAVASERVRATAGFNQDVRPENTGFDVDGGDFGDADADLIFAKPRTFVTDDSLIRHFDDCWKKMVSTSPPASAKDFRIHAATLIQEAGLSNWI